MQGLKLRVKIITNKKKEINEIQKYNVVIKEIIKQNELLLSMKKEMKKQKEEFQQKMEERDMLIKKQKDEFQQERNEVK